MYKIGAYNLLEAIKSFDLMTFHWCHQRKRFALLAAAARQISRSADGWMYLFCAFAYVALRGDAALAFISLGAAAYACERSVYFIMKNSFRRRRPTELLADFRSVITASDRFSFPSGHTSAAFLWSGLCTMEFGAIATLPLYAWSIAVGASRVVLGVHFPSDIAAGAMLGSVMLICVKGFIAA